MGCGRGGPSVGNWEGVNIEAKALLVTFPSSASFGAHGSLRITLSGSLVPPRISGDCQAVGLPTPYCTPCRTLGVWTCGPRAVTVAVSVSPPLNVPLAQSCLQAALSSRALQDRGGKVLPLFHGAVFPSTPPQPLHTAHQAPKVFRGLLRVLFAISQQSFPCAFLCSLVISVEV